MPSTTTPTRLGNVWLAAALLVQSIIAEGPAGPRLLTIDQDGMMEAVGPEHPEYETRLLMPGFIGMVDKATSHLELAAKIRAATLRVARSS